MISVGPNSPAFDRDLLDASGGFLWWYADMLDDAGNGCVMIWSFGLPFLPGYASDARNGDAPAAGDKPSLNICVYRRGRLDFYLLQEYPRHEVDWQGPGRWRFGETTIESIDSEHRHILQADIDCAIPGTDDRLTGDVSMNGPTVQASGASTPFGDEIDSATHEWRLFSANADAQATLTCDRASYAFTGRGYHDGNAGRRPFQELGIGYWIWGRVRNDDEEKIFYVLWSDAGESHRDPTHFFDHQPHAFGLSVGPSGGLTHIGELSVRADSRRTSFGGMPWWRHMTLVGQHEPWLEVSFGDAIDSGPFYRRCFVESMGQTGIGEFIAPHRIDLARHRPLVNMRVDHIGARNSMWLPLFSGPKEGRVERLFKQWWQ